MVGAEICPASWKYVVISEENGNKCVGRVLIHPFVENLGNFLPKSTSPFHTLPSFFFPSLSLSLALLHRLSCKSIERVGFALFDSYIHAPSPPYTRYIQTHTHTHMHTLGGERGNRVEPANIDPSPHTNNCHCRITISRDFSPMQKMWEDFFFFFSLM